MVEYIDKKSLIKVLKNREDCVDCTDTDCVDCICDFIACIVPSNVAEVRHGKWIGFDNEKVPIINGCPTCSCRCSLCRDWLSASDEYFIKGNYCPNCGAKMGDDEE